MRLKPVRANIARLAKAMGIERPVAVTMTTFADSTTQGRYLGMRDGTHRISIRRHATLRGGRRALCHELEHARQCEQDFGGDFRAMRREWGRQMAQARVSRASMRNRRIRVGAYNSAPLERGANEAAERWIDAPLVQESPPFLLVDA